MKNIKSLASRSIIALFGLAAAASVVAQSQLPQNSGLKPTASPLIQTQPVSGPTSPVKKMPSPESVSVLAPLTPPGPLSTSVAQPKSPSLYKIGGTVREMLDIEAKAALASERATYGIKGPEEIAKETKETEAKVKPAAPADTFEVKAIYGVSPAWVAEVAINGKLFVYHAGKSAPESFENAKGAGTIWRLVKFSGDCVYLSRSKEKKTREVCYEKS